MESIENSDDFSKVVADHYDKVQKKQQNCERRKHSVIIQLRNFNNFCKALLIGEHLSLLRSSGLNRILALDLCCGKGGDLFKWKKGNIEELICADISKCSIDESEKRYYDSCCFNDFDCHFIHADCCKENIWALDDIKNKKVHITSCQFALNYAFESIEKSEKMLQNACQNLENGGYFIGIMTDAFKIVETTNGVSTFSNCLCKVRMDSQSEFPLFGSKYYFKLDELVDCPEFLIYFPLLQKMLEKYDMKLIKRRNLQHYFLDMFETDNLLLTRMGPLRSISYDEFRDINGNSNNGLSYNHLQKFIKKDPHVYREFENVLTISKEEWDVIGLYQMFSFQRINPPSKSKADINHITN